MKAIMLMFDSLNRRMLSPYGCDWVQTPNFQRLAERSVTFEQSYIASAPCMPARREIHTGRPNFLHRSWGPLEPFDDSMPALLHQHGIHTHLASDHYHYWEEGGCNYHTHYSSWEAVRGQEGDHWKADLRPFTLPETLPNDRGDAWMRQDWLNRRQARCAAEMPQARTFALGEEFLHWNSTEDNWFLTVETFDPHEPYFAAQRFRDLYPDGYAGPHFDWPNYRKVSETPEQVAHLRNESAALHSMCDHYLGRMLDLMDELHLWDDTLLIVNTDHGFLLGEHDWWAKCVAPFYDEVAHTPLFIWDPRCRKAGERRQALVQTIDLAPTLLDYFGASIPPDMLGKPLAETVAHDANVHEAGLFGLHGGFVNVTDGRYVYMRAPETPENTPLYEYTLMPTHMQSAFAVEEFHGTQMHPGFPFTQGCPVMKIPAYRGMWPPNPDCGNQLFDLATDPQQQHPLRDPALEARMIEHLCRLLEENDAPVEQYTRLGLPAAVAAR